jgi:hypothetical protein
MQISHQMPLHSSIALSSSPGAALHGALQEVRVRTLTVLRQVPPAVCGVDSLILKAETGKMHTWRSAHMAAII